MKNKNITLADYRLQISENNISHHPFSLESEFLKLVKECNLEEIYWYLDNYPRNLVGLMSENPLKQMEYISVIGITMVAHTAIAAGLDSYVGYNTSDIYLQKIAKASSIPEYEAILRSAIKDIINKLKLKQEENPQPVCIKKAIEYIQKNITVAFSIENISEYAGISSSRLSVLFHQHMKQTIHQYVIQQRISLSEDLLIQSDMTISEIASFLCFSSASHFSSMFKSILAITPSEYRLKNSLL